MELKHLKLIEPGFEKMTGNLGGVDFKDGVSVEPLTGFQASRISSAMRAEFVDGSNSSAAGLLVSERGKGAEVVKPMERASEKAAPKGKTGVQDYIDAQQQREANREGQNSYSRSDLEFIADEDGIAGIREVAKEFGVKGKSISALVEGILAAQNK